MSTRILAEGWFCPRCKAKYPNSQQAYRCCGLGAIRRYWELIQYPYYTDDLETADFSTWCQN